MNRFDEIISRRLQADRAANERPAERIIAALATRPLPEQRHSLFRHWPSVLLDNNFAPAWPRLAALASVALIGGAVGFFGPSTHAFQSTGWVVAAAQNSDFDMSGPVFEPEPLTGARP